MTSRLTPAAFTQLSAAVAALFAFHPAQALDPHALPSGGQVVAGQASISQTNTRMDIRQTSERVILNWQGFDIGAQAQVNFLQPTAAAVALNRVVGVHPSEIQGRLTANGQVFLINPNGILFGAGAQVDVGGLVASTLKLSDADFLAGNVRFTDGNTAGGIVNQGNITAAEGGYVALIAPRIRNDGDISAPHGSLFAAAGDRVTLHFADNRLLDMEVSAAAVDTLIENHQALRAPSGHILLRAEAAADLASSAINHGGLIDASAITGDAGRIELLAGMSNGRIDLSGTLKAQGGALPPSPAGGGGAGGEGASTANGGQIETSAAQVKIADTARVDTRAPHGSAGTWLIDPTDYTVAASGGDISGATLAANLQLGNVTLQTSAAGAGNGDLFVNDAVTWSADTVLTLTAHRDIQINRNLTATGNAAGLVLGYGAGRDYTLNGARVTLAGSNPLLKIGVAGAEETYTVINSLGVAGDTSTTTLQGMKNNLTGRYALGSDIDASATSGWNGGAGWEPVGRGVPGNTESQGQFHGLGHVIQGLAIDRPSEYYVGLFGKVRNATVRNTGMENGNVRGYDEIGGLIGGASDSRVLGSYFSGSVTGTSIDGHESVGRLVGHLSGGSIAYSWSSGVVDHAGDVVGGLAGYSSGAVSFSHSNSAVSGNVSVGGLVGWNSGTISDSYSTGAVTGNDYVGGIAGVSDGMITGSYSTGSVNGGLSVHQGGLAGYGLQLVGWDPVTEEPIYGNAVINSFWNAQTSGQASSNGGGTPLTTAQMQQQASYTGWDFTNTWRIYEGQSYPVLRALQTDLAVTANDVSKPHDGQPWAGGNGVAYSVPGATPAGSLAYGGTAQGAVAAGTYSITPTGLASDQRYHVAYADGTLTILPPPPPPVASNPPLPDALAGIQPRVPGNVPHPPGELLSLVGEGIRLPEEP